MTLLRLFVIVLVLVNLVLLVQLQGWLGGGAAPSSAEHRAAPLHPERIRLRSTAPYVPSDSAAQAAPAQLACLRIAGLKRDTLARLRQRAGEQAEPVDVVDEATGGRSFWVHLAPAANRVEAERRAAELKALGVTDLFVTPETHAKPHTVSVGLFKDEAIAREAVQRLANMGIRDVELDPRGAADTTYAAELRGPRAAVEAAAAAAAGDGLPPAEACAVP